MAANLKRQQAYRADPYTGGRPTEAQLAYIRAGRPPSDPDDGLFRSSVQHGQAMWDRANNAYQNWIAQQAGAGFPNQKPQFGQPTPGQSPQPFTPPPVIQSPFGMMGRPTYGGKGGGMNPYGGGFGSGVGTAFSGKGGQPPWAGTQGMKSIGQRQQNANGGKGGQMSYMGGGMGRPMGGKGGKGRRY